jgi:hypothetical protein
MERRVGLLYNVQVALFVGEVVSANVEKEV